MRVPGEGSRHANFDLLSSSNIEFLVSRSESIQIDDTETLNTDFLKASIMPIEMPVCALF